MKNSAWFLPLLLPALLPAQNTSCSVSGTVQDPAGAVIVNAKVIVTGEGNGFVRTVTTTNEGLAADKRGSTLIRVDPRSSAAIHSYFKVRTVPGCAAKPIASSS